MSESLPRALCPEHSPYWASANLALETLAEFPNTLWEPAECPLCARGIPLD